VVAVSVGDVDLAVRRVDRDVSRLVQEGMAGVESWTGALALGPITFSLGPDLQEHLGAVARPFLDNAVVVAA
jgi:hypothetical protein